MSVGSVPIGTQDKLNGFIERDDTARSRKKRKENYGGKTYFNINDLVNFLQQLGVKAVVAEFAYAAANKTPNGFCISDHFRLFARTCDQFGIALYLVSSNDVDASVLMTRDPIPMKAVYVFGEG